MAAMMDYQVRFPEIGDSAAADAERGGLRVGRLVSVYEQCPCCGDDCFEAVGALRIRCGECREVFEGTLHVAH